MEFLCALSHSGKFHADDVLAWSLLCHFHPNGHAFKLNRTRDENIIEADIVFDVGGIYDPRTEDSITTRMNTVDRSVLRE